MSVKWTMTNGMMINMIGLIVTILVGIAAIVIITNHGKF